MLVLANAIVAFIVVGMYRLSSLALIAMCFILMYLAGGAAIFGVKRWPFWWAVCGVLLVAAGITFYANYLATGSLF